MNPEAIFNHARSPAILQRVSGLLDLLPDESSESIAAFYRRAKEPQHVDILTVLCACSRLLHPSSYLEVGVRRGRTMAVVAFETPGVNLYGFDMWLADYGGMQNPGPEFVASEVRRIGATGRVELVTGNSHETLPKFFEQHPGQQFDLITIDGDHSESGAREDLESVLPKIAPGGVIVFDDIAHPEHLYLQNVWEDVMRDRPFLSALYNKTGYGVAIAQA